MGIAGKIIIKYSWKIFQQSPWEKLLEGTTWICIPLSCCRYFSHVWVGYPMNQWSYTVVINHLPVISGHNKWTYDRHRGLLQSPPLIQYSKIISGQELPATMDPAGETDDFLKLTYIFLCASSLCVVSKTSPGSLLIPPEHGSLWSWRFQFLTLALWPEQRLVRAAATWSRRRQPTKKLVEFRIQPNSTIHVSKDYVVLIPALSHIHINCIRT